MIIKIIGGILKAAFALTFILFMVRVFILFVSFAWNL